MLSPMERIESLLLIEGVASKRVKSYVYHKRTLEIRGRLTPSILRKIDEITKDYILEDNKETVIMLLPI